MAPSKLERRLQKKIEILENTVKQERKKYLFHLNVSYVVYQTWDNNHWNTFSS